MAETWRPGAKRPLAIASLVIAAYLGVEVVGAVVSGSLALLADAAHTGSDLAALSLALLASWVAGKPHSPARSFGFLRAEVLAALLNGAALLVLAAFIFVEAVQRIGDPPEVRGAIVSLVATGGLVANGLAAWVLMRSSRHNLNLRSALYHVVGDGLGSVGAIVGGLLVVLFGWQAADPAVSIFIGLILLYGAIKIVREATHVLMEGTPSHIDVVELRDDIEGVEMIEGCHDLHTWTITSGYDAMSAHVTISDECVGPRVTEVRNELGQMLRTKYGLSHVTIQIERGDVDCQEEIHVPDLIDHHAGPK